MIIVKKRTSVGIGKITALKEGNKGLSTIDNIQDFADTNHTTRYYYIAAVNFMWL